LDNPSLAFDWILLTVEEAVFLAFSAASLAFSVVEAHLLPTGFRRRGEKLGRRTSRVAEAADISESCSAEKEMSRRTGRKNWG
jgi:hypothetical protein